MTIAARTSSANGPHVLAVQEHVLAVHEVGDPVALQEHRRMLQAPRTSADPATSSDARVFETNFRDSQLFWRSQPVSASQQASCSSGGT
jgi:hypothetical protein